jgi:hypothetical protein
MNRTGRTGSRLVSHKKQQINKKKLSPVLPVNRKNMLSNIKATQRNFFELRPYEKVYGWKVYENNKFSHIHIHKYVPWNFSIHIF